MGIYIKVSLSIYTLENEVLIVFENTNSESHGLVLGFNSRDPGSTLVRDIS